ncbi:MAG: hypothetical protein AABY64_13540 [Bdellovibrionota bacterium]
MIKTILATYLISFSAYAGDINQAVILAGSILDEASRNSSSNNPGIFKQIRNTLASSDLAWPQHGSDFTNCSATTLAYVVPSTAPRTIFLCQRIVHAAEVAIAQTLIHEAAHLYLGNTDECAATAIEVVAMEDSGVGLAYKNSYISSCLGN